MPIFDGLTSAQRYEREGVNDDTEYSFGAGLVPPGLETTAPYEGGRYHGTRASDTLRDYPPNIGTGKP